MIQGAVCRVPALADVEVIAMIRGPEAFTPDGEFVLGEAARPRGFFGAAGFCAHGIAGAGGVGEAMAARIRDGRPPFDVSAMDVRPFGPEAADRDWAVARARRAYGTCYDVRLPEEALAPR